MEIKPSLFSLSGFFAPGFVFLLTMASLLAGAKFDSFASLIGRLPTLAADSGWAFSIGLGVVTSVLTVAFVLGTILSETFIYLFRRLLLRNATRNCLRTQVARVFKERSLRSLLSADMDARESFVFMKTCGLDLHWYAGRVRMMGGTGLGLMISSGYSAYLGYSCVASITLLAVSALSISVAMLRSYKFDEYVSASAAVLSYEASSNPISSED